ncbi:MAG: hypothetical protein U9O78_02125 [Patescibacteria group bacterium]|nr:hypothetical protein [Patescibacteria group bacterium]
MKFKRKNIIINSCLTLLLNSCLTLLLIVLAFFSPIFTKTAKAESPPLSLSVSPPTSYLYVKPSEAIEHTLILRNTGSQDLEVKMQLTDFKADGKTGRPLLSSGSIFDKLINPNLDFGKPFIIEAQDNRAITLNFDTAKLVGQKEYPLSILFHAKSIKSEKNQASFSQVSGTIASNLIVFISENEENQGKLIIEQLKVPKLIDSFHSIKFSLKAKNVGSNAMPVQGRGIVKNFLGQTINEFVFYPDQILAKSSRQVRGLELKAELFDENQELIPEKVEGLAFELEHKAPILFGLYQLEIELDQEKESVNVIALPFSVLVVGVAGIGVYLGYKQLKKNL